MKICFLCKTFLQHRGGTEAHYFRMANALSQQGHQVTIVAQEGVEKSYFEHLDPSVTVIINKYKPWPFRGAWRIDKFFPVWEFAYSIDIARKIKEIEGTRSFNILQVPDWSLESFCLFFRKRDFPIAVRLHGIPDYEELIPPSLKGSSLRKWFFCKMVRFTLLKADALFSVSNEYAGKALESIGQHRAFKSIYNGIDQTVYQPSDSKRENFILFVGRLEIYKGIEVIAKAIPMVLKDYPEVKFVFGGRACPKEGKVTWQDHLQSLEFKQNLIFLGRINTPEVVANYQKCLLAIFPSLYEPGGTVVLEAMACGCPVVASNVGGIPESIDDGVDGLLVTPNDARALAEAIKRLLKDENLRNDISKKAVEKVTKKFSLSKAVAETQNAYEEVINQFSRN